MFNQEVDQYRRGTVLGLTLAEAVILIVFCLLLVLGGILSEKEKVIEELNNTNKDQADTIVQLVKDNELVEKINEMLAESGIATFEEAFRELRLLEEKTEELNSKVALLQEKRKELATLEDFLDSNPNTTIEDINKTIELIEESPDYTTDEITKGTELLKSNPSASIEEIAQVSELLQSSPDVSIEEIAQLTDLLQSQSDLEVAQINESISLFKEFEELNKQAGYDSQAKDIIKKIDELEKAIDNKEGQVNYLKKKLDSYGRGTEKPACWVTSEGKPEYIFQVALTSGGVIIHDNIIDERISEKESLPINSAMFDDVLGINDFRMATTSLFDWSVKNECRFFVKVFDRTNNSEKIIYKKLLRAVQEHFYIYETINETPIWIN